MSDPSSADRLPPYDEAAAMRLLAAIEDPDWEAKRQLRCRCVWRDERCENQATAEDGLCNWCGNGRPESMLRRDPKAIVSPDGKFFGIGGAGQIHDSRPGSPGACWYPDSDRVVLDV